MLLLDCMLRYWTYCSGSTRRRSVRHEKTTVQVLMCVHWCRFVFGVTFVNDFFLHQFWKGKCDGQLCRPNVMVSCAGQMWWSVVQAKCDGQLCRPNVTVSCAGQMWRSVVQAKSVMLSCTQGRVSFKRVQIHGSLLKMNWENQFLSSVDHKRFSLRMSKNKTEIMVFLGNN